MPVLGSSKKITGGSPIKAMATDNLRLFPGNPNLSDGFGVWDVDGDPEWIFGGLPRCHC